MTSGSEHSAMSMQGRSVKQAAKYPMEPSLKPARLSWGMAKNKEKIPL